MGFPWYMCPWVGVQHAPQEVSATTAGSYDEAMHVRCSHSRRARTTAFESPDDDGRPVAFIAQVRFDWRRPADSLTPGRAPTASRLHQHAREPLPLLPEVRMDERPGEPWPDIPAIGDGEPFTSRREEVRCDRRSVSAEVPIAREGGRVRVLEWDICVFRVCAPYRVGVEALVRGGQVGAQEPRRQREEQVEYIVIQVRAEDSAHVARIIP